MTLRQLIGLWIERAQAVISEAERVIQMGSTFLQLKAVKQSDLSGA